MSIVKALKMYNLLQDRDLISISELSKKLEVSERMIKTYKNELNAAGLNILSKAGKYGGYYLDKRGYMPKPLNPSEKEALDLALSFLEQNQFVLYDKVSSVIKDYINNSDRNNEIYKSKFIHDTDESIQKNHEYFSIIKDCIKYRQKLIIKYYSLSKQETKDRTVCPFNIIEHKDTIYMIAYCELKKDVRLFKLSRILDLKRDFAYFKNIENTEEELKIKKMIDDAYGIYFGKVIEVELEISHPFSEIIMEKVISPNQIITVLDNTRINFKASMSGAAEIESWILSMGEYVKVIGCPELKENLRKRIEKMYSVS